MLPPMPKRFIAFLFLLSALVAVPMPASATAEAKWAEAEAFEQQLIDCTRSGGWVAADGSCDRTDGGRVPRRVALKRSTKISDELSRPYARRLAQAGYLTHFLGGSIDQRFKRIGMGGGRGGENIGYTAGRGTVKDAVLHIHRLFQAEWSYNGPHWKNLVDGRFSKIGVGVWVRDGRTYLVLDFHS